MRDDADLVWLMKDEVSIADLRDYVARTGEYPTVYHPGMAAGRAFEEYLTGWIPSDKERTAS